MERTKEMHDTTPGVVTVTRKQHMAVVRVDREHGRALHDAYQQQFVTPELIRLVVNAIGPERIRNSTDPHMNDIPLRLWDDLHVPVWQTVGHLIREADPCGYTLCNTCCVAKRAAEIWKGGE